MVGLVSRFFGHHPFCPPPPFCSGWLGNAPFFFVGSIHFVTGVGFKGKPVFGVIFLFQPFCYPNFVNTWGLVYPFCYPQFC